MPSHCPLSPMLPELLKHVPPDQDIGSVTADGACDTCKCHDAIAERNAHAVIPPRKNAKPWKPASNGAIARNQAVEASGYLGRTLWRRWSGYHRRSRVETKMHCVKRLGQSPPLTDSANVLPGGAWPFGSGLGPMASRCLTFDRQVAESQIRIAVPNRHTALGIPVTEPVGSVRPEKGKVRSSLDLCNIAYLPIRWLELNAS